MQDALRASSRASNLYNTQNGRGSHQLEVRGFAGMCGGSTLTPGVCDVNLVEGLLWVHTMGTHGAGGVHISNVSTPSADPCCVMEGLLVRIPSLSMHMIGTG